MPSADLGRLGLLRAGAGAGCLPTTVRLAAEDLGRITACSKGSWRAAGTLSVLAADEQGRLTLVKDSWVELTIVALHADEEELGLRAAYGALADA